MKTANRLGAHTSSIYNSGKLETQALAKRRSCLDEDIFAFESSENNLALMRSIASVTMYPAARRAYSNIIPKSFLVELTTKGKVDILQRITPYEGRHRV